MSDTRVLEVFGMTDFACDFHESCVLPVCLLNLLSSMKFLVRKMQGWLLDSGASVTVLSNQHAAYFSADLSTDKRSQTHQQYSAASGSAVVMRQLCQIGVFVVLTDEVDGRKMVQTSTSA